jgi:hypothetical protein
MIGRHEPCLSPPEAAWRAHRSLLPGTPRFIAQKQARGPAAWFRRRPESVDQPACCLACAAVGFPDHQRRRPRPSAHGAMFNGPALHVWRRVLTQRSANAAVPARFVYGASSLLSTVTFGVASAALANQKPRILRRGLCRFELQIRRLGPTDAVSAGPICAADSCRFVAAWRRLQDRKDGRRPCQQDLEPIDRSVLVACTVATPAALGRACLNIHYDRQNRQRMHRNLRREWVKAPACELVRGWARNALQAGV